ncbi:helix-turn-helix domain-containing protein [Candidatus Williamhamiltonella defendens]|uniref:helix-turn-helix domain-containing protein n=1 Tax=Candidatus Williamhamiltonella defendens TaxID=138072 RepID=UPI0015819134|nr:helix-turn-helix transcriptional regulator [Candidatus Hamiltonella defensa]
MKTLSIDHGKKLKAVRLSEGMTQIEFSHALGIGLGTIKNYEAGIRGVGLVILDRVTNHPKFSKYTLWLMTNSTTPEYGQIAPDLLDSEADKVKEGGRLSRKTEEVVEQISSQKPNMQLIISCIENLDDNELQQLAKLLSRRGTMLLLELLDLDNQSLLNLPENKKRAALRLESMGDEQFREILSKIEGETEFPQEEIDVFSQKTAS